MKEIGSHKNIVNFLGACTVQGNGNYSSRKKKIKSLNQNEFGKQAQVFKITIFNASFNFIKIVLQTLQLLQFCLTT